VIHVRGWGGRRKGIEITFKEDRKGDPKCIMI